jgi:hypothetical protein
MFKSKKNYLYIGMEGVGRSIFPLFSPTAKHKASLIKFPNHLSSFIVTKNWSI